LVRRGEEERYRGDGESRLTRDRYRATPGTVEGRLDATG
jgi:hypothetical protein